MSIYCFSCTVVWANMFAVQIRTHNVVKRNYRKFSRVKLFIFHVNIRLWTLQRVYFYRIRPVPDSKWKTWSLCPTRQDSEQLFVGRFCPSIHHCGRYIRYSVRKRPKTPNRLELVCTFVSHVTFALVPFCVYGFYYMHIAVRNFDTLFKTIS